MLTQQLNEGAGESVGRVLERQTGRANLVPELHLRPRFQQGNVVEIVVGVIRMHDHLAHPIEHGRVRVRPFIARFQISTCSQLFHIRFYVPELIS